MTRAGFRSMIAGLCLASASVPDAGGTDLQPTVADTPTRAQAPDGRFISWREHVIDDPDIGGTDLSGSDGLAMADLDGDGFEDIVSVHESDTVYDNQPLGHVRIAFGTGDPDRWERVTLASGAVAAGAEDVAIGDANGDGHPDIVVACELAHLAYFQNPGTNARTAAWDYVIPPIASSRGSFLRAFFADVSGTGRPAITAANKGEQNPSVDTPGVRNISLFLLPDDPLDGRMWREQVLGQVRVPVNAQPVDLDGDGDLDVVGGSRGEGRILWFENRGQLRFDEHAIAVEGTAVPEGLSRASNPELASFHGRITGFNMDYADLDSDGRLDIVLNQWPSFLVWLRQPASPSQPWKLTAIGGIVPDMLVSVRMADIDGDGDLDAFTGGYSLGPRDRDGDSLTAADSLGRIAWFQNPGHAAQPWVRHDISRRKRGMYDKWLARDLDGDGDLDFVGTRGNSEPYDGVIWLEQVRTDRPVAAFRQARTDDSQQMPLAEVSEAAAN